MPFESFQVSFEKITLGSGCTGKYPKTIPRRASDNGEASSGLSHGELYNKQVNSCLHFHDHN